MKLFESQSSRVRTEVLRIQIFKLKYAHWILVFNLGEYRRQATEAYKSHDFFRPDNTEAMAIRSKVAMDALQDVCDWIESGGEVAVRCRPLFFLFIKHGSRVMPSAAGHHKLIPILRLLAGWTPFRCSTPPTRRVTGGG